MSKKSQQISDYSEAIAYLDGLINFERKMPAIYKAENVDPDRTVKLLAKLGDPHRQLRAIHVAGSKGKGSVCAMCATALQASGLRVGLYTSPHLIDMRERIRILTPTDNDGKISEADFARLVSHLQPFVAKIAGITWFEVITALAFHYFAQQGVDVAVIEVGLGGRLDATNVVQPLVTVITPISLEHTNLLGDTVAEIAGEKAGIIKPNVPVVCAPQPESALAVIHQHAQKANAPFIVVGEDVRFSPLPAKKGVSRIQVEDVRQPNSPFDSLQLDVGLLGRHQQENGVVALTTLRQLQPYFPTITPTTIQQGIAGTRWQGRLQLLRPPSAEYAGILLDGAHNADSAQKLATALPEYFSYNQLWF